MAFSRGRHIAVAFLTQDGKARLPSAEPSRELHLTSLDATTGKIVANRTWPAPWAGWYSANVGATREGNFVMLQHDALSLYSPDLQEINRVDVPADSQGSWYLVVPPGGDSIFLGRDLKSFGLRMLDARTLRELRSWDKPEGFEWKSGKYFASLGKDKKLYTRGFDTPWRPIADLDHCREGWWLVYPKFINDDSLIASECDSVRVIRVDGQVLFTARLPKNRLADNVWGSVDGRFVAVATTTMRGNRIAEAFDMGGPAQRETLVYDTKSGSPVGTLKGVWALQHEVAFSPDSDALAQLSCGIVEMFGLPQPSR